MKKIIFSLFLIGFVAGGLRIYQQLNPSQEDIIIKKVHQLEESVLFNLPDPNKLLGEDVSIEIELPFQTLKTSSRPEALLLLKQLHEKIINFSLKLKKIEFLSPLTLETAHLQFEALISGQEREDPLNSFNPKVFFEVRFLKKNEAWKISEIQSLNKINLSR